MAWNVSRSLGRVALPQPEILKWPLSTARLPSVVVNAEDVEADVTDAYGGRRFLLAGTILSLRTDGQYEQYVAGMDQAVDAILFRTTEFADDTDKSDKPVAILDTGSVVDFNTANIVDYDTYETELKAAFTKANFDEPPA